ncbi:O-antigen ligase family protein [Pelagibacterales bacterium SAG-MED14]|nr:O-antigen ligase family protein [Pelagibacterales bacterium SAG-MED14]
MNGIRFYAPYLIVLPILLICIFRKINFDQFILIFLLYFFSQIIGSLTNEYYENIRLENYYLAFNSIIFLSSLNILKEYNFEKILFVFKIASLILSCYLTIYLGHSYIKFLNTDYQIYMYGQKDFYNTAILGNTLPHVTGLARVVAFFLIYLFVSFYTSKKNKKLKLFLLMLLFFFLWGLQSRSAILLITISLLIFIFLYNRTKIISSILLLVTLFLGAAFLWDQNYFLKSKIYLHLNNEIIIESTFKKNRFIQSIKRHKFLKNKSTSQKNKYHDVNDSPITSGRSIIWKRIIDTYDTSKFFGYGVQGDRFILKKLNNQNTSYGSNASNSLLYAFSSGGYLSLITFILINLIFLKELITSYRLREKFKTNKERKFSQFISILILFIMGRSLIENSHAYFGIDFLLICISFYLLRSLNVIAQKS